VKDYHIFCWESVLAHREIDSSLRKGSKSDVEKRKGEHFHEENGSPPIKYLGIIDELRPNSGHSEGGGDWTNWGRKTKH